jgi:hypothetical protein
MRLSYRRAFQAHGHKKWVCMPKPQKLNGLVFQSRNEFNYYLSVDKQKKLFFNNQEGTKRLV